MPSRSRFRWWLIFGAALLVASFFLVLSDYSFYRLLRLKAEVRALQRDIERNRQEQTRLTEEIERLRSDSTYMEKVVREELHVAAPGEKLYVIEGERKEP